MEGSNLWVRSSAETTPSERAISRNSFQKKYAAPGAVICSWVIFIGSTTETNGSDESGLTPGDGGGHFPTTLC
jgi:hypothetical protein